MKLLAKLEPIAAVIAEEVRPMEIPPPAKPLSPPIIALENVAVGYEPQRPVLRRLSLRIDDDDRIALIGANGNGKSTLVKLLAERIAPMSGQVTRAQRLGVGYFAQHQLRRARARTGEQGRRPSAPGLMPDAPEAKVRARAGAIGFPASWPIRRPVNSRAAGQSGSLSGLRRLRVLT